MTSSSLLKRCYIIGTQKNTFVFYECDLFIDARWQQTYQVESLVLRNVHKLRTTVHKLTWFVCCPLVFQYVSFHINFDVSVALWQDLFTFTSKTKTSMNKLSEQ